jgi:hypothetical protein
MKTIPLSLGTQTEWGKISAVGNLGRERYYWIIADNGTVSMLPADVVETLGERPHRPEQAGEGVSPN